MGCVGHFMCTLAQWSTTLPYQIPCLEVSFILKEAPVAVFALSLKLQPYNYFINFEPIILYSYKFPNDNQTKNSNVMFDVMFHF